MAKKGRKTAVAAKSAKKTTSTKRAAKNQPPAPVHKLAPAWSITATAARLLWSQWRIFLLLTLIYGVLNLIFVRGLAGSTSVGTLKDQVDQAANGNLGSIGSGLGVFVVLLGSSGNGSSPTAGAYQLFLTIIVSLAVIWALRQVVAGKFFRVRDAFYNGMFPLIPFLLVLLIIGLQLIPLLIGSTIYAVVMNTGIAAHLIEKVIWTVLFAGLAMLSFYWLASSLFALYVVTLPRMTPLKALRSAKDLVRGRRLPVLRKIFWLPLILFIGAGLIMLPLIAWSPALAQWIFFILTTFGLIAIHTYMYCLYRELLNE
jgi:hypothetical protein